MVKILLVDDEECLLESLSLFFEDDGCQVFKASSGEEALEVLRREQIDACIVDMRLPGIDGNGVIRTAMQEGLLHRFLIHTGSADYLLPDDLRAMGMTEDHVFLKPILKMGVIVDAVTALLEDN